MMLTKEKMVNCVVQSGLCAHKRDIEKPNEDFVFIDEVNGIFVLLDGITRVHKEYEDFPYQSAASRVNDIFFKNLYGFLIDNIKMIDKEKLLKDAIDIANQKIFQYRKQKSLEEWGFYPATLGIIAIIEENILHYACVGDCIGVLLRNNTKIIFGRQLTLEALDNINISKKERYLRYCNHPENELSYGVFNGDDVVSQLLECSYLDIHKGDTLILASDGIANFVKYETVSKLRSLSVDQMLKKSEKYDVIPYTKYADDKAVIKIEFK